MDPRAVNDLEVVVEEGVDVVQHHVVDVALSEQVSQGLVVGVQLEVLPLQVVAAGLNGCHNRQKLAPRGTIVDLCLVQRFGSEKYVAFLACVRV